MTEEEQEIILSHLLDGEQTMDKEATKDALNKASFMYPYEVKGKPETYSLYNAWWQDAVDYLSKLLGMQ